MALAKKQSPNNRIIIIAIVVVAVAGLSYFIYTRFSQGPGGSGGSGTVTNRSALLNFNASILNNPQVTNLNYIAPSVTANINDAGQPYPFR